MSLDFKLKRNDKNLPGYDLLVTEDPATGEEVWSGTNEYLAFASLSVDLGELKPENVDEWTWRLHAFDIAVGGSELFRKLPPDVLLKIASGVGYITNVTTKSRADYKKRLMNILSDTVMRRITIRS